MILLPEIRISAGPIVIAGAVLRGEIAANALVMGNPAAAIGRASLYLARLARIPNLLDTPHLPEVDRRAVVERHFFGSVRG
ncbi:MAG: hypothetical protein IT561_20590 [Alphaproteobacteria bacterium]|nr:hypothetical protein [Alphaproteobacteria bacterium]